ncbi:MAG TPA: TrbI/VirB10 family protein [Allosphingosinicella sp.]|jgi:type IV secretion system protein VirB10
MASRTPPVDPRMAAASAPVPPEEGAEAGVRPVVALPRTGLSGPVIAIGIALAAIILFVVLDSRRRSLAEPAVKVAGAAQTGLAPPPPPLYIPPPAPVLLPAPVQVVPAPRAERPAPRPYAPVQPQPQIQQPVYYPQQNQDPMPMPPPPQRTSNSPSVVIDNTGGGGGRPGEGQAQNEGNPQGPGGAFGGGSQSGGRVQSGVFANRSTTVALGTLVPAVLETAFDSRRPGFARAIVSRDVRGFDGTRVLIPRGSRLTGEYRSDIQPGQKRALINWTRLIRPDGITMALSSPAADTLGRGGVRGDYDSHFFQRFAGAILQSALQVGVNVASRAAAGNVIVALPGSTQVSPGLMESARILPTLTVPAGTSISVFVARDLDFSRAERAQ